MDEMTLDPRIENATSCLVAYRWGHGPQIASVPCWSDGTALWMAVAAADPLAAGLREAPGCRIGVGTGLVASGTARVFSFDEPLALLVHSPVICSALAALALHHARDLARGWLQQGLRPPPRLVAVRVGIDEVEAVETLALPPGIAPGLPDVVPADIRRRLSGLRHVLVAAEGPGGAAEELNGAAGALDEAERPREIVLVPATWGAGFSLDAGPADPLPTGLGTPLAVAVTAGDVAVTLTGTLDERRALRPVHARWWDGARSGAAVVPSPLRGAVQLPD
jgi:hypothetical protein